MKDMTLNFAGICIPNPGLGAWGYYLDIPVGTITTFGVCEKGKDDITFRESIVRQGVVTEEVASYWGCIEGLRHILNYVAGDDWMRRRIRRVERFDGCKLFVRGHSERVISQINRGMVQSDSELLAIPLARTHELAFNALAEAGVQVIFEHVPREANVEAIRLSEQAWEEHAGRIAKAA